MKKIFVVLLNLLSIMVYTQKTEENNISDENKIIPFDTTDEIPLFSYCDIIGSTYNEKKRCVNISMRKHVAEEFNFKIMDSIDLYEGKRRTYVKFTINRNGEIKDIHARAPHPALHDEIERTIKLLPKMIPGKLNGKPIAISYILPITFNIE